jgi:hypothetical protein
MGTADEDGVSEFSVRPSGLWELIEKFACCKSAKFLMSKTTENSQIRGKT